MGANAATLEQPASIARPDSRAVALRGHRGAVVEPVHARSATLAGMRRAPVLAAACIVALCASACRSSSDSASTHVTFRSAAYPYSIVLPGGWTGVRAERTLSDGQAPVTALPVTDVLAQHATRRIRQLSLPALVVGAQAVSSSESLQSWADNVIALVGRFKGCPSPATTERVTIAGHAGLRLEYPNCPPGQGLYHVWTVAVVGGRGYQFVWFNAPGNEVQDRAILDGMLRSVSFSK